MSEQKHLVDVRGLKEYFPVKSGMLNKMLLKAYLAYKRLTK